ncbi:patatin-domain-containing protein [Mytilinidion resinicola]|uniref:Patatin-domain-containing protein n=1 Tax=Mytilinidion resinicola TaxID=574789 RepID=A0A6A6Z3B3_9PEZI|nr:patatin-domain-containing protein [Mytilinidion resinicola]KAF2815308.1 patatin-domain-containing protein [Mytilinidion resinicola]
MTPTCQMARSARAMLQADCTASWATRLIGTTQSLGRDSHSSAVPWAGCRYDLAQLTRLLFLYWPPRPFPQATHGPTAPAPAEAHGTNTQLMSFLYDPVFPGANKLFAGADNGAKEEQRVLRKSRSHAGFLSPLIQLVRDPVGTIGSVIYDDSSAIATDGAEDESRREILYLRMREAETYDAWRAAATELDLLEGNDAWKAEHESLEYDYALVEARLKQLDEARVNCDVKRMLFLIRTSLTRGLGGMGDLRLYKHSHVGTKALIERYIDSAQKTLRALLEVSAKQNDDGCLEHRVILEQLLAARQSFGRSALLMSGGGTFGMNHIGVIKSLWNARLLPRIISGASAGSIVCAVLCIKTDEEIPQVLEEFCYGDLNVFDRPGQEDSYMDKVVRFLKYGSLFEITHLITVMRNLLGDITFQEAYNRTRRILNITVSSASLYELPRLLNYVTAPNVLIWSAVAASCSVPFVFLPASLLAKDPRTGEEVPWNPTPNAGWIDGSVDNDLPMTRLAEMFNVNHFIVSQVNPHVVPFLVKEEEMVTAEARQSSQAFTAGPSWLHYMANLAKGEALHRLHVLAELGVFPNYLTKMRSILNQRYSGDITIFPAISLAHFPKVLSNPTTEYMLQCTLTGERATWPKLSRVQNHVAIELALDETIRQLRARVVFSPSQVDLRLSSFTRPLSQGDERAPRHRSRPPHKITRFEHDHSLSKRGSQTSLRRKLHTPLKFPPGMQPLSNTKPYLPSHSNAVRRLSNPDPQHIRFNPSNFSAADLLTSDDDSDCISDGDTELPPSPPLSPSTPSSTIPNLWPSTRQLFPSVSQPSTPSLSSRTFAHHRTSSSLNLAMTKTAPPAVAVPSSPERKYKALFHLPPTAAGENTGLLPRPGTPRYGLTRSRSELAPPPPVVPQKDGAVDVDQGGKETKKEKKERKRREKSGAGGLGLLLDISGTRGMMLRRKRSRSRGSGGVG